MKRGRKPVHTTIEQRRAAAAEAAARYRANQRAKKAARRVASRKVAALDALKASTSIDLSALGYSRRR